MLLSNCVATDSFLTNIMFLFQSEIFMALGRDMRLRAQARLDAKWLKMDVLVMLNLVAVAY